MAAGSSACLSAVGTSSRESAGAEPDLRVATIVIPLRASPALFEWQERLARILALVPRDLFEILIVDYGTMGDDRERLASLVRKAGDSARILRVDREGQPFAIGQARDLGAIAATAPVILFNDIDFIAPAAMYRAIADEIRRVELERYFDRFFCVPVVFLTEARTSTYLQDASEQHRSIYRAVLEGDTSACISIAYASSCFAVNRQHYLSIGGHDADFWGHGAEDFEFLHRLCTSAPKVFRPPLYYADLKDNGITRYRGFRAAFAVYGIEAWQRGLFLVHLFHAGRKLPRYAWRRRSNFRLLRRRMQAFDRTGVHPPALPDHRVGAAAQRSDDTPLSLGSSVFQSFGGRAAMEAAIRESQRGDIGMGAPGAPRRVLGRAALQVYRAMISWRLPGRQRALLRHVPEEFLASRTGWFEGLLRRLIRTDGSGGER